MLGLRRSTQNGPQFEAEVQIGKGMRFIDRNGSAAIDQGLLRLCKSSGEVIAEAPIGQVSADRARMSGGAAATVWIKDVAYTIEPLRVVGLQRLDWAGTRPTSPAASVGLRRVESPLSSSSASWSPKVAT